MSSRKEDLFAALHHKEPPVAVPIWEVEFQGWEGISGKKLTLGKKMEALPAAGQDKAMHANAELIVSVAEELHWSAVTMPGGYWEQSPGELAFYCLPGDTQFRQIAILREVAPPDIVLVAKVGGILSANYSDEFCEQMFDEPERIDELAAKKLAWSVEVAKRSRDAGAEIGISASDIADNSGPFFNPEQMERWIYPNLTRWSEALHAMGLGCILHSDGYFADYVERIASTGIDGLQAIDPMAGMDIVSIKKKIAGRLCLCGNVDCGLLLTGTPEQVFAATKNLLEACKPGGGFVLGASNAVQFDVPAANYRAIIEAWKEYGAMSRVVAV